MQINAQAGIAYYSNTDAQKQSSNIHLGSIGSSFNSNIVSTGSSGSTLGGQSQTQGHENPNHSPESDGKSRYDVLETVVLTRVKGRRAYHFCGLCIRATSLNRSATILFLRTHPSLTINIFSLNEKQNLSTSLCDNILFQGRITD